jgi:hypothetical protein
MSYKTGDEAVDMNGLLWEAYWRQMSFVISKDLKLQAAI